MKVLYIIPSLARVRGGPSQVVLEMVKALRSQDVNAEIATINDNGSDLLDVPLQQRIEYEGVPVWFFPRFSSTIESVREFSFSCPLTQWLWQHIGDYDLLHVTAIFSYPSTAAMAIARLRSIPYIVMTIGQLCEWSLQQSARKKQIYLSLIERANLNRSRAILFTSHQEQQETSRLGFQAPNFVLPHGLTLSENLSDARERLRHFLQAPPNEPVILFMSRLHPKKGLDYLIPALEKNANRRFTFVLAGSGDPEYEAEIDSLLDAAGIRDRTYRPGFISGTMKEILLQGSDLFVLTSHSENFGIAVLEALAAGVPALVTPGVALAEAIEKYQLGYVTPLDIGAIAAALQDYFNHPQEAQKMGDRARQIVIEQYTWNRIAANLIEFYTAILKKSPIPAFY